MYLFARAAVTKYHTDWVAQTTEICFLTGLEARSPGARCWQGWVLLRPLSVAGRRLSFPCVFTWPSLWVCLCPHLPFYKDTSPIGIGPTPVTPFSLSHVFKDVISQYCHILKYWGLGLQRRNSGGGARVTS